MNVIITWLLPLLALFGCSAGFNLSEYDLVWEDNFDTLDLNKWQHEITAWGGGNNEFEVYTQDPANSYVVDGKLHIKPTLLADSTNPLTNEPFGEEFMETGVLDLWNMYGDCTQSDNGGCYRTGSYGDIPPTMSARLRSFEKFSFTFGLAEVRAKMPVGDWMWPAIWMLPEDWAYGDWPLSGEIDIIESIGNRDYYIHTGSGPNYVGIQKMHSTLHWGVRWDANRYYLTSASKNNSTKNYGDDFHTFYFDWSPNGLRFFVDDKNQALLDIPYPLVDENPEWTGFYDWGAPWPAGSENPWINGTNLAPFDQAFHFILNVAVGGTNGFIPDGGVNRGGNPNYQKPWSNGDDYRTAMDKFYYGRHNWKWTWDDEGENAAMQVDYIKVYKKRTG